MVGNRSSANTRKLVEVGRATGVPTHHIESAAEIDRALLTGDQRIGVTAGASTPDEVIEKVVLQLQSYDREKMRKKGGTEITEISK